MKINIHDIITYFYINISALYLFQYKNLKEKVIYYALIKILERKIFVDE